ncbi:MAG: choice-of-anchor Q domain-containing protein [Tahibacter sp.]
MKFQAITPACVVLLFSMSVQAQTVRRVPANYPTIQGAIAASVHGDTVLVSPGTYYEHLNMADKRITLRSTDGPAVTIVDASQFWPVLRITGSTSRQTVVEGFTLTHGYSETDAGGIEIVNAQPIIRNNTIVDNASAHRGAGISMRSSSALIVGNRIVNNQVYEYGQTYEPGGGGGVFVAGDPCTKAPFPSPTCGAEIRDNLIEGNSAQELVTGGGIKLYGSGPVNVVGNVIRNNASNYCGGGIVVSGRIAGLRIENNLIVGNIVSLGEQGGGICAVTEARPESFPLAIVNNTIIANSAPAGSGMNIVFSNASLRIVNNLIVAIPSSTGIECIEYGPHPSPGVVTNNNVLASGASAYAGQCAGSEGVDGNRSDAPTFVGPGSYRLAPGSAGIDAGSNAAATETLDLARVPRVVDGNADGIAQIDIGAYESGVTIFIGNFETFY